MRRVLPCFMLIWFLAGCGGGAANNNPFAGSWSGSWSDATAVTTGTLSLIIGNNGSITGTEVNTTTSASSPVIGNVNSGGQMNLTYQSSPPTTESGFIGFGPTGALNGNLTETQSGTVLGVAAISLSKQ